MPRPSVDIEMRRGQINTVGFTLSAIEAATINALSSRMSAESHFRIWSHLCDLLEGNQPKVLQNFIYETCFFSRYGAKMKIKERTEKYWICEDCVKNKHPDWGSPGVVTVISGLCGHCDREDEATLIPVRDFPRKGHKVIWD